jgi:hypothetical protein
VAMTTPGRLFDMAGSSLRVRPHGRGTVEATTSVLPTYRKCPHRAFLWV